MVGVGVRGEHRLVGDIVSMVLRVGLGERI